MGQIYLVTNTDDNNDINPAAYILKYIGENRLGGTTFANLDEALTACDTRWQELGWIVACDYNVEITATSLAGNTSTETRVQSVNTEPKADKQSTLPHLSKHLPTSSRSCSPSHSCHHNPNTPPHHQKARCTL